MPTDQKVCPCGSGTSFEHCCGPCIQGGEPAKTAEALMRSRYSAYCQDEVDYLVTTTAVETRDQHPAGAIRDWNRGIEWLALQINETAAGKPADTGGTVDFTAIYRENGRICTLREMSRFVRRDGNWYYLDGVHKKAKLDRNQPCPCGSGRKFKKCCGQAT